MASTSRRSRLEIHVDVLRAISEGRKKPTSIMSRANIIWPMLQDTLDLLIQRAFVSEGMEDGKRIYVLTPKGLRVLQYFSEVREMLAEPICR